MAIAGAEGLVAGFTQRLEQLFGVAGLSITSGFRSRAKQQELWDLFRAGKGPPANQPGSSWHEYGLAADLGGDLVTAHALARGLGLWFPITGEPWHVQPLECTTTAFRGTVPAIPTTTIATKGVDDDMATVNVTPYDPQRPNETGVGYLIANVPKGFKGHVSIGSHDIGPPFDPGTGKWAGVPTGGATVRTAIGTSSTGWSVDGGKDGGGVWIGADVRKLGLPEGVEVEVIVFNRGPGRAVAYTSYEPA